MIRAKGDLPDKPSELIRVALADLESVERDARYSVRMGMWHDPNPNWWYEWPRNRPTSRVCTVCLAGAVMARSLDQDPSKYLSPNDFDGDIRKKLLALDKFRQSAWQGLWALECKFPGSLLNRVPPNYGSEPTGFKLVLDQIATDLEGIGL